MQNLVEKLTQLLLAKHMMIATAESCTGGLIASAITHEPGASRVFERGFVTYSNEAKTEELGVPAALLESHGAISAEVAQSMAEGALNHSRADLALSVTGIAGPDGGSAEKPVGLVYIGYALKNGASGVEEHTFSGTRSEIQNLTAESALTLLIRIVEDI